MTKVIAEGLPHFLHPNFSLFRSSFSVLAEEFSQKRFLGA
jgi:hypothetical protein